MYKVRKSSCCRRCPDELDDPATVQPTGRETNAHRPVLIRPDSPAFQRVAENNKTRCRSIDMKRDARTGLCRAVCRETIREVFCPSGHRVWDGGRDGCPQTPCIFRRSTDGNRGRPGIGRTLCGIAAGSGRRWRERMTNETGIRGFSVRKDRGKYTNTEKYTKPISISEFGGRHAF